MILSVWAKIKKGPVFIHTQCPNTESGISYSNDAIILRPLCRFMDNIGKAACICRFQDGLLFAKHFEALRKFRKVCQSFP